MKRPLILVSNDDSIAARGVHELIDRLVTLGDVVAVCPKFPHSGQSMAITIAEPLRIDTLPDYHGAKMYAVNGTPVDCIKLSIHHLLPRKPDLVVAGINHGSNAAVNVLYSGTMGAAMEGAVFGCPSVGFSLTDHSPEADFTPCFPAVTHLCRAMLQHGMPESVCLNVNVPAIHEVPREMRLCTPCRGSWNDEYQEYIDPSGKKFYLLTGKYVNEEPDNPNTDEYALAHGIISVTLAHIERGSAKNAQIPWLETEIGAYNSAQY